MTTADMRRQQLILCECPQGRRTGPIAGARRRAGRCRRLRRQQAERGRRGRLAWQPRTAPSGVELRIGGRSRLAVEGASPLRAVCDRRKSVGPCRSVGCMAGSLAFSQAATHGFLIVDADDHGCRRTSVDVRISGFALHRLRT